MPALLARVRYWLSTTRRSSSVALASAPPVAPARSTKLPLAQKAAHDAAAASRTAEAPPPAKKGSGAAPRSMASVAAALAAT